MKSFEVFCDPQGMVNFDVSGIIWTTLVVDLQIMFFTKYESVGPCSFETRRFSRLTSSRWCRSDALEVSWVQNALRSIPGSGKIFFRFFVLLLCLYFILVQKPYLSWYLAFHIEIYLVYWTYCKLFLTSVRVWRYRPSIFRNLFEGGGGQYTRNGQNACYIKFDIFHVLVFLVYCTTSWMMILFQWCFFH